ncbi:Serine/threonine-protein kinase MARK2 [Sciurus carolinensis]|uniref:non-specific serine/threonine protein kinase n=1 Tax=Sciurus carolinensis TaxID=30640 RepID=A0AA41N3I0_SCICA|nr:Serine/threonine-protein kinase MARK2 [Sciurus carolinensis]
MRLAQDILMGTGLAVKALCKGEQGPSAITTEVDLMKAMERLNMVQLFQVIETPGRVSPGKPAGGGPLLWHIPVGVGLPAEEARAVPADGQCPAPPPWNVKVESILLDGRGHVGLCALRRGRRLAASPGEMLTASLYGPEPPRQEFHGPMADVCSPASSSTRCSRGAAVPLMEHGLSGSHHPPAQGSTQAHGLIAEMLTVDPTARPTLDEVLGHLWLSPGQQRCGSAVLESPPPTGIPPRRGSCWVWVSASRTTGTLGDLEIPCSHGHLSDAPAPADPGAGWAVLRRPVPSSSGSSGSSGSWAPSASLPCRSSSQPALSSFRGGAQAEGAEAESTQRSQPTRPETRPPETQAAQQVGPRSP